MSEDCSYAVHFSGSLYRCNSPNLCPDKMRFAFEDYCNRTGGSGKREDAVEKESREKEGVKK